MRTAGMARPGQKLDEAERKIFAITDKKVRGSADKLQRLGYSGPYELIEEGTATLLRVCRQGMIELDDLTCGLQNGEMIILAGRPSMGKTQLGPEYCRASWGLRKRRRLRIFSLETSKQQLAERFLCSHSQIDAQLVRKGILGTEDYERLRTACGELYEAPIYVDDTSLLTPLELRAKARRLKSLHNVRCIIVDYLQLMHISGRVESRQQEMTIISRY